jgi:hypothetical protein
MSKTRYKIRKEQLERVVESFVMESTKGGNMIHKDAAKKHKMNMGAEQHDDMGEGMKKAPVSKKNKMKHAPEVKKHVKGKVSEQQIKKAAEYYNLSESEVVRRIELLREEDEGAFAQKVRNLAIGLIRKDYIDKDQAKVQSEKVMADASKDNYDGDVKFKKDESGGYVMYYVPKGEVTGKAKKASIWQRLGMGTSSQTSGR